MSYIFKTTSFVALLMGIISPNYVSSSHGSESIVVNEEQLPLWAEKYKNSLPKLTADNVQDFQIDQKAEMIMDYLCQFFPPRAREKMNGQNKTAELTDKIKFIMEQHKPLSFVICGFPFKSPNHENKCLSAHADIGEYLALMTLQTMMENIKIHYKNIYCKIISDGLPFHTIVDPGYEDILMYHQEIEDLLTFFPLLSFVSYDLSSFFNSPESFHSYLDLEGAFKTLSFKEGTPEKLNNIRVFLEKEFNCTRWEQMIDDETLKELNMRIKPTTKKEIMTFNTKRNRIRKEKIGNLAKDMTSKTEAFSYFITDNTKDSIRLSINISDSMDLSKKIPIGLIYGHSGTPWHNPVVMDQEGNVKGFYGKPPFLFPKKTGGKFECFPKEAIQYHTLSTGSKEMRLGYIHHT